jgi:hypothetical protein
MPAEQINIEITKGIPFRMRLTVAPKDNRDEPLDISGYKFISQLRYSPGSNRVAANFKCDILDQVASKGQLMLSLTDLQTASIVTFYRWQNKERMFFYDVMMERPNGTRELIITGRATVFPTVSRG